MLKIKEILIEVQKILKFNDDAKYEYILNKLSGRPICPACGAVEAGHFFGCKHMGEYNHRTDPIVEKYLI